MINEQLAFPHSEHSSKRFYKRFKDEHAAFLTFIEGIPDETERAYYTTFMLTRLMFLYFLQSKGLLANDVHYLANRLAMIQNRYGPDTFYRRFLLPLFHGSPDSLASLAPGTEPDPLFGDIPAMPQRLFTCNRLACSRPEIQIPDAAFARLFAFFDTYGWQLDKPESGDNNLTHDVLGYIFEQYSKQQQLGTYYTKNDVTTYMARYSIIPALFDKVRRAYPEAFQPAGMIWQHVRQYPERYIYPALQSSAYLPLETERDYTARQQHLTALRGQLAAGEICTIDDFITYNLDSASFARDVIEQCDNAYVLLAFFKCLNEITILDPTCGSGAFLFAALHVLEPLYKACIQRMQTLVERADGRGRSCALSEFQDILARVGEFPNCDYFALISIITHNLHGVDIMQEAADICYLRLYLELLGRGCSSDEIKMLPTIGDTIRVGNALVGFVAADTHDADVGTAGAMPGACPREPGIPGQAPGIAPAVPTERRTEPEREELDRQLAREYGLDGSDAEGFAQWRNGHSPFHWCLEFRQIMDAGGFDVILGNPPYVEYDDRRFGYTLQHFETLACGNLYTCVVERCRALLSPLGRQGMILPLAAFATRNMQPFIEGFRRWFPCSWLSFYHFRPSMLFTGDKVASIPTAIFLARAHGEERRFSTFVAKWLIEQRDQLFSSLSYCAITAPRDPLNRHYYPKFGSKLENSLMEKVLKHTLVKNYLVEQPGENTMFYRSAGGLYWKVFTNFPWPYQATSNKQCTFHDAYERDVFVALFNSSLFWWYYTVTFDTFNLKDYMLFGFRFTYPQDEKLQGALTTYCQRLMHDYKRNARHLKRGEAGSYTIYARKSKAIIDEIDRLLAQHYSLTEEELDFLINYDLKYRMGSYQVFASSAL